MLTFYNKYVIIPIQGGGMPKGVAYSEKKKLELLKLWLLTGNLRGSAASLGIPWITAQSWRYSDWWVKAQEDMRTEGKIVLSNKLKKIVDKSLDVLYERLENGDYVFDQRTGGLVRKPVSAATAVQAANTLLDKQIKLESGPEQDSSQVQVTNTLKQLAEAFASFAKKTHKVEVIDAVYDERKKGLLEGEAVGEGESSLSAEGSSSEEPGTEEDGERDWEQTGISSCGPQEGAEGWGDELQIKPSMDEWEREPLQRG